MLPSLAILFLIQDAECTEFLVTVKQQLSDGISNTCNCSYTRSKIMDTRLYCFQQPKYISVRGFIKGSGDYTAQQILEYMKQWHSNQSTVILTDNRVLNMNKNCKLHITHWNEKECTPSPIAEFSHCYCNGTSSNLSEQ